MKGDQLTTFFKGKPMLHFNLPQCNGRQAISRSLTGSNRLVDWQMQSNYTVPPACTLPPSEIIPETAKCFPKRDSLHGADIKDFYSWCLNLQVCFGVLDEERVSQIGWEWSHVQALFFPSSLPLFPLSVNWNWSWGRYWKSFPFLFLLCPSGNRG